MQQIINSILRNKNVLIFLLLFSFGVLLTIASDSFRKSTVSLINQQITGAVFETSNQIKAYFFLQKTNSLLLNENIHLKNQLALLQEKHSETTYNPKDTLYFYRPSRVISNSFSLRNNYLMLNSGKNQGILPEMGVTSAKGIVGIVSYTSNGYATVISLLNSKTRVNARLLNTHHFGSLEWDGLDPSIAKLVDVPIIAPIKEGDTIVTGGNSYIFPAGLPIGYVHKIHVPDIQNYYEIDVKLFNDMTNLNDVYVIENLDRDEVITLQKKNLDE
jgi:rod shape-determining protein MreC